MTFRGSAHAAAALAATAGMLLIPLAVSAQTIPSGTFTLSVSPQYPQPYSTVVISPKNLVVDLTGGSMTATVNDRQVYQGDIASFSITLGGPGSTSVVEVSASTGGEIYTQTLTLRPGDVSLVVEPQASVPPLYPGRPAVPLSGNVRLIAMPDFRDGKGAVINPATLSYTWTAYGAMLASQSGVGKRTLSVPVPLQYRSGEVTVLVQTVDGAQVGNATIALAPQEPTVRLYEQDSLLGIRFDHALSGTFSLPDAEASLYAAPFSFSLTGGGVVLDWFLNGMHAQNGNVITLRPTGSGEGNARVSVTASKDTGSQQANATLNVSFGTRSTNIFGL